MKRLGSSTALAAVLLAFPLSAAGEETRDPPPFLGETLRYTMSVFGVVGGEMTLSTREVNLDERAAYKFELSAVSNDMLSKFFLVRDFLVSWVDPRNLRSLRFEKHTVEGKRVRDELIEFDYEEGFARRGEKMIPIGETAFDSLSSVYYLRTLPLEVGNRIELEVVHKQTDTLHVEVQARERITVPAGTFSTIRVEPKSKGASLVGKGKSLILWLTDDERKIPVQIRSKLNVGTLIGRLKSIETSASAQP